MSAVVNPFTGRWIMEPKPQNVWGIPHALWFTFMGVGGALFLDRALFGVELGRVLGMPLADLLSLLFIGVGGLILIADLGRPFRVLRALANPRTSWISIGAICDFIFMGLDGLWTLGELNLGGGPLFGAGWASSPLSIAFQVIAGAAALVVIVYPGLVLAFSPSIPFWNTTLIPLQFLAYAFSSAVGLALVSTLWAPVGQATLRGWLAVESGLLVVCLLLQVAHLLNGSYSHTAARISVQRLLGGELQPAFVYGTLVLGLLAPAALGLWGGLASTAGSASTILAAAGLVAVVGNWFSKFSVIKAGTYAPFL
ncbi:MAG: NrfD/PsrC family molybdoenzyme membrane anchor subunit [Armatimonadota bacterium]|nr:NrfD/PsrC family molybdoenzyme membrane anchor subunit [Armatimonadota bacterium]